MKSPYFCENCDNKRNCGQNHLDEDISEEENSLIEMWIECFLLYQGELTDKTYGDLFHAAKPFAGCAVCKIFLRRFSNDGIEFGKGDIHWSSYDLTANELKDAYSHLQYYPFECFLCEKNGKCSPKDTKKLFGPKACIKSQIIRHITRYHSMYVANRALESIIKSVKIRKLESLIEYSFQHQKQVEQTFFN